MGRKWVVAAIVALATFFAGTGCSGHSKPCRKPDSVDRVHLPSTDRPEAAAPEGASGPFPVRICES